MFHVKPSDGIHVPVPDTWIINGGHESLGFDGMQQAHHTLLIFRIQLRAQRIGEHHRERLRALHQQIIGHIQFERGAEQEEVFRKFKRPDKSRRRKKDDIVIEGVGNLMTQFAKCCKPVPGDDVIGFITIGSGITIHKRDCRNVLSLPEEKRARLVEVEWGSGTDSVFPAEISITAFDRTGLLRDISGVLANDKINLLDINSSSRRDEQMVYSNLVIEVSSVDQLVLVIDRLSQIPNVQSVKRIH